MIKFLFQTIKVIKLSLIYSIDMKLIEIQYITQPLIEFTLFWYLAIYLDDLPWSSKLWFIRMTAVKKILIIAH